MIINRYLIPKDQQVTTKWAGGTTTQIAIYPIGANYQDRDFTWRLSTAVVELEQSTFTKLPGFDRCLMVLEGKLELKHDNHHTAILHQFEQDCFKGGWNTTSYGKARDFNLMVKEGVQGKLEQYKLMGEACIDVHHQAVQTEGFVACYCYQGAVKVQAEEEAAVLKEGDLIMLHFSEAAVLSICNADNGESVFIAISIDK